MHLAQAAVDAVLVHTDSSLPLSWFTTTCNLHGFYQAQVPVLTGVP